MGEEQTQNKPAGELVYVSGHMLTKNKQPRYRPFLCNIDD